jgi:stage II sporulation protein D
MYRRVLPKMNRLAAALAGSLLAALALLAGCHGPTPPVPEHPLHVEGVPTIRGLVSSGPSLRVWTKGPYRVVIDGREAGRSRASMNGCELTVQGTAWQLGGLRYQGNSLSIEGLEGSAALGRGGPGTLVGVGECLYRGNMVFSVDPQRGLIAVNHVDLESYLAGVLAKELYPSWHPQTYQALAVAARTFAMYESCTTGQSHRWDVMDNQASQAYGGVYGETSKSWQAVRSTHGQVLTFGPAGHEKIFRAHYSSCCGGMSNNVCVLYGQPVGGPLAGGQVDDDCGSSAKFHWPAVVLPKDVIYRSLVKTYPDMAELGGVRTIQPVDELYGRTIWLEVVGVSGGRYKVRADDLRLALLRGGDDRAKALYSMNCQIRDTGNAIAFEQGRGFGHGVGLCQYGAEGKAIRGLTANQILAAYYPGAKLKRAY